MGSDLEAKDMKPKTGRVAAVILVAAGLILSAYSSSQLSTQRTLFDQQAQV